MPVKYDKCDDGRIIFGKGWSDFVDSEELKVHKAILFGFKATTREHADRGATNVAQQRKSVLYTRYSAKTMLIVVMHLWGYVFIMSWVMMTMRGGQIGRAHV